MIVMKNKTHLIHDNSGELKWFDYNSLGIEGLAITPYSPNMNAYAERFVRSIRNECLDKFIVFNQRQLRNIVSEYVRYYNSCRPHQGIDNEIPDPLIHGKGEIRKKICSFWVGLSKKCSIYVSFIRVN